MNVATKQDPALQVHPVLVKPGVAARMLGVSPRTLQRMKGLRRIYTHEGARPLYEVKEIEYFVEIATRRRR